MDEVMRIENSGMDSAVRQIGDSWSLLIVWSALHGTTRFDNFQSRLGVARNILSKRLSKLVDEGIFVKRPVHSGARRPRNPGRMRKPAISRSLPDAMSHAPVNRAPVRWRHGRKRPPSQCVSFLPLSVAAPSGPAYIAAGTRP